MWLLNNFNTWTRLCFGLAIFCLPFQLNAVLYQVEWGRGFLNPYATIQLYSSEVFLFLAGLFFSIQLLRKERSWNVGSSLHLFSLLIVGLLLLLSFLNTPFLDSSFQIFLFIKYLELLLFYFLTVNQSLHLQTLLKVFIGTMLLQSFLALFQGLSQGSLGLHFLGEPHLTENAVHLAHFQWGGWNVLRSYGTFPHPNVLAGFLVVSILLSSLLEKISTPQRVFLVGVQSLALLSTFSRTGLLALSIAILVLSIWSLKEVKKRNPLALGLIFLLLVELIFVFVLRGPAFLQDQSFQERLQGYKNALEMFKLHPLGVGWNHYTLFLDQAQSIPLMPWEYQPVHNAFLLALAELGTLGVGVILLLLFFAFYQLHLQRKNLLTPRQTFKRRLFLVTGFALLFISIFDHYLMTLDQGRWLCLLVFGLSSTFSADPRFIFPLKKENR